MPHPPLLSLPADRLPTVQRAVHASHHPEQGNVVYHYCTCALHLYDYPAQVRIGRHRFDLEPGDITLTPARTDKRYYFKSIGRHWCIHFFPADNLADQVRLSLPYHLPADTIDGRVPAYLKAIIALTSLASVDTRQSQTTLSTLLAACRLQTVLLLLAQSRSTQIPAGTNHAEHGLQRLIQYIHNHPDQTIDSRQAAAIAELSPNYLARKFKQRHGMTIRQYIRRIRIQRACELMTISNMSIQSIAAQVGLADLQFFNKTFRQTTGLSPTAWRRQTDQA